MDDTDELVSKLLGGDLRRALGTRAKWVPAASVAVQRSALTKLFRGDELRLDGEERKFLEALRRALGRGGPGMAGVPARIPPRPHLDSGHARSEPQEPG